MTADQDRQLHEENVRLKELVLELQDTLDAIRSGEVDALVHGDMLFTLESAESASNRFRGYVLQHISDTVIAVDMDYNVTYLNEAAEKQYDIVATEVLGKGLRSMFEYAWLDPGDEERALEAIRVTGYWRGENLHVRKDGTTLHVESVVTVLQDNEGLPIGYLAVMRDLSESIKARRALEEAARQKDHFLATLAHELRNPLSPLMNGLELLDTTDSASVERTRSMMKRQMNNLVRLVDDLMDMSRITRGKFGLRKEIVDLKEALATAVETSRALIDHHAHDLEVRMHGEPLWVNGDRTRLAQIISNLLNNAAKYTPRGGRIQVELDRKDSDLHLCVKDNGIGIAQEDMHGIFDMFAQVKDAMPGSGGLGIGLNIAQRLATLHGGTLVAKSDGAGKGSTFTLVLPAAAAPAPGSLRPADRNASPEARSTRILVVDDNRDGASSLALLLRRLGHEVEMAHNGADALIRGDEFRPELVLMDLGMPVMDGFEACKRMRIRPWGQRARIIAVSGWGQPQDRERGQRAGFDEHVIKPIERHTIERVLRAVERSE